MTPERYQQVIAVFERALQQPATKLSLFLDQTCAGDSELRREVESLLQQEDSPKGPLDRSLWLPRNTVSAGTRIGSYVLETVLGEGGMGVVYRARDTKLNRPVAVKFLSDELADSAARKRFQREAKLASALNHPHILTVHDAGELDGREYLVTEFVDGGTLRDWAQGTPGWQQITDLLAGVADALACAHEAGILHRDIKPENVLVTKSGYAKLADFGLAKLVESIPNEATRSLTGTYTRPGVVVGTIAYMSPEQAAGRPVDARSDIFSFGIVLYELLAGKRPFHGSSDLETLQKIIHEPPEPLSAPPVPPELRSIVEKALRKEQSDRYQTMREVVTDLRRLARSTNEKTSLIPPRRSRRLTYFIAAAVLVVVGALTGLKFLPSTTGVSGIRSLAVLPLENVSADSSQEYFSAGITESLISTLAQIHSLRVISRTSVMHYKGTNKTVREIGRELGVDAILEGSVQRAGNRVRISAQLIRAATDSHIWAQEFVRDASDVLRMEAEVAQSIASSIRVPLTVDETQRFSGRRRINSEAQEAYLRGRYHSWNFNDDDQREAIRDFEEAVRLQPDFAAAYAGIAVGWNTRVVLGFAPFSDGDVTAHRAAMKAIELDPSLPDAHDAMGGVAYAFDWAWRRCEMEFQRAIELDPNYVDARNDYSYFLIIQGRLPEAIAQIERAAALDPLSPGVHVTFGLALARSRSYSEAQQHFQRVLQLDPKDSVALASLANVAEYTGDFENAIRLVQERLRTRGGDSMQVAQAGRIFAKQGRRAQALQVLANVTKPDSKVNPMQVASLYVALGDKERALRWLTKAFDDRNVVLLLKTDPLFDSLHSDPRFQALLRRLGVPD